MAYFCSLCHILDSYMNIFIYALYRLCTFPSILQQKLQCPNPLQTWRNALSLWNLTFQVWTVFRKSVRLLRQRHLAEELPPPKCPPLPLCFVSCRWLGSAQELLLHEKEPPVPCCLPRDWTLALNVSGQLCGRTVPLLPSEQCRWKKLCNSADGIWRMVWIIQI